ncbi:pyridoxal phosphate-dependent aminotransferase [Clostridium tunisiense]|uniref:pyridoxal phosphate-dependent aminotransferase n=1 Tax=Clostridium tunisiense TaxID=219748 RepID=UPI000301E615|nr:aminotransferase class I/II-fold pyridoxal phosphate-dependent enzyme [Clostridium tunisiense]
MENMFSKNVESIEISGIRKFFNKVANHPGAISLTLGEPDFKIPKEIKEAMKKAIDEDKTTYTPNAGILQLRQGISDYLLKNSIRYNENEICVTVGGSEALLCAYKALLNEGDKVLVPAIGYPAYESCGKLVGAEVLTYKLKEDFSLDIDSVREIINQEHPKVLIVSFPSNPTGAIMTEKDRDELHALLKDEDILIISDEIYSAICFEEYYSISQCEDIKEKVILVSGFSKMFSMTGIRVGYICATENIMNSIIKVHQYNVSCAPSIGQYGALAGLKDSLYHCELIKEQFESRKEYVYQRLKSMGLRVELPKGAFYIFPSINKFNLSSEEFCEKLLESKKVAIVPGSAFGVGGEGYIRISYCYSMESLKIALDGLEEFIKELSKK